MAWFNPAATYAAGGLDRETGQNIPAALWQRLMDVLTWIGGVTGAWVAFTPTLTQLGAVTVTVTRARYQIILKTAFVDIELSVTGSGTTANDIVIGAIPAAIAMVHTGARVVCGHGEINDSGNVAYGGVSCNPISASTVQFTAYNQTGYVGTTPNFALASGDKVCCNLQYEIA